MYRRINQYHTGFLPSVYTRWIENHIECFRIFDHYDRRVQQEKVVSFYLTMTSRLKASFWCLDVFAFIFKEKIFCIVFSRYI